MRKCFPPRFATIAKFQILVESQLSPKVLRCFGNQATKQVALQRGLEQGLDDWRLCDG